MPKLRIVTNRAQQNIERIVNFEGTPTVREVLNQAAPEELFVEHPCGGTGTCGRCRIDISGNISEPDAREKELGYRLSCRTRLAGDAELQIMKVIPSVQSVLPEKVSKCGIAIDIGTTNIVLGICDLEKKEEFLRIMERNPQTAIAADVMGRIGAAMRGELSGMSSSVKKCIGDMLSRVGIGERCASCVITGNTAMLYILCQKDTSSLATAPFRTDFLFGETADTILSEYVTSTYIPRCTGAFTGADLSCAILHSGMCVEGRTALLADIGTNAEIALWKKDTLFVTSAAAGPAFEGSGMKGSEVIDILAELLRTRNMDYTGLLTGSAVFSQKDIRDLQMAKGAVMGGIRTLLEETGTSVEEVGSFYIAGAFGSGMNLDNASSIGLFPPELKDKAIVIGNAALEGAEEMLFDFGCRNAVFELADRAKVINLGGNPKFNSYFIESMNFPK